MNSMYEQRGSIGNQLRTNFEKYVGVWEVDQELVDIFKDNYSVKESYRSNLICLLVV